MMDDSLNLDSLLHEMDEAVKGEKKYVPHPPRTQKSPNEGLPNNPKTRFAIDHHFHHSDPKDHHSSTTHKEMKSSFSPNRHSHPPSGGKNGRSTSRDSDENSLDQLLNMLNSPMEKPKQTHPHLTMNKSPSTSSQSNLVFRPDVFKKSQEAYKNFGLSTELSFDSTPVIAPHPDKKPTVTTLSAPNTHSHGRHDLPTSLGNSNAYSHSGENKKGKLSAPSSPNDDSLWSSLHEDLPDLDMKKNKHGNAVEHSGGKHKPKSTHHHHHHHGGGGGGALILPSSAGTKARCSRVVIAGPQVERGLKSSAFAQTACDHLLCVKCNFKVLNFPHKHWTDTGADKVDYLFFRNNMPNESKLAARLLPGTGKTAYCCQCSWAEASDPRQLTQGNPNDPQWICSGH